MGPQDREPPRADAPATDGRDAGLRWPVLAGCLVAGISAGGLFYASAVAAGYVLPDTRWIRLVYVVLVGPPLLLANITHLAHAAGTAGRAGVVTSLAAAYYVLALLPVIVPSRWRLDAVYSRAAITWIAVAALMYGILIVIVLLLMRA